MEDNVDTSSPEDSQMNVRKNNKKQNITRKDVKPTFTAGPSLVVRENIKKFQELSEAGECVIGSGMCAKHNTKLVRNVIMKKCSNVSNDGTVSWTMREVTVLTCPAATKQRKHSVHNPVMPYLSEQAGTNGKRRKVLGERDDQPQAVKQSKREDTDRRLEG